MLGWHGAWTTSKQALDDPAAVAIANYFPLSLFQNILTILRIMEFRIRNA